MVLFEAGAALAEALAIGRRSGIAPETLLTALTQGSADRAGVDAAGARLVRERFAAVRGGDGERYWPVIAEHVPARTNPRARDRAGRVKAAPVRRNPAQRPAVVR
jgi:hypothetical protein